MLLTVRKHPFCAHRRVLRAVLATRSRTVTRSLHPGPPTDGIVVDPVRGTGRTTMRHMARLAVRVWIGIVACVLLATPGVVTAAELSPSEQPGRLTPNQLFGGRALTTAEALAACGPAAAVAFANATGRAVSLDRAVAIAREVGWTPARGMSGPYGQMSLLQKLNIPATIQAGLDPAKIRSEVQTGRPVIIRTAGNGSLPGHYFVAERLDTVTGRYDLAQSALVLKSAGGRRWFTLSEIGSLGAGAPTHTIYLATAPTVRAMTTIATPLTALATATTSATSGSRVVATGGTGANLRAAPGTTEKIIGALVDGARVTPTGATATVAGRVWQRVTLASGTAAWMDGSLLRAR
jgi:hypothetical protein